MSERTENRGKFYTAKPACVFSLTHTNVRAHTKAKREGVVFTIAHGIDSIARRQSELPPSFDEFTARFFTTCMHQTIHVLGSCGFGANIRRIAKHHQIKHIVEKMLM